MKKSRPEKENAQAPMRLNKFLANAGVTSRRKADELISTGKISVNDEVIKNLGETINPETDTVKVDGKRVQFNPNSFYILMNKPTGCVCTANDPEGRVTVFDLLKSKIKLFTVGRLDFNTEGLLIITNDGELGNLISNPRSKVKKVYQAKVRGVVNERSKRAMTRGVVIEGMKYSFSSIKVDRITGMNSWITVTLFEGKNRQIHKVCDVTGHRLIKLKRVQLGKLLLGTLKPGEFRPISPRELALLKRSSSQTAPKTHTKLPSKGGKPSLPSKKK